MMLAKGQASRELSWTSELGQSTDVTTEDVKPKDTAPQGLSKKQTGTRPNKSATKEE